MNPSERNHTGGRAGVIALALAILLVPAAARAQLKDGRQALAAGRYDDAIAAFEKAAADGQAEGRAGVGQVWLKRRQYDKALEAFQTALKMDPGLALGFWGEAEVARRRGDCASAVPLYTRATELDRKFPEAQLALGQCLIALNQHEKAVAALNEGLKWGPRWRPKFLVALGDAELARDSLRDAGIYYTKAREEAPEDPAPRKALGDFYVKRGIPAMAVPEYQAATSFDTSDVELVYALGHALDLDNRAYDALEQYRKAVAMDSLYAPADFGLGYLLYRAGQSDPRRYDEARGPLETFVRLEPRDARGWSVLARDLYFLRERDAAFDAFLKADSLGEKAKDNWTIYARLLAERREYDAALAAFQKGDPEPADKITMARIDELRGRYADAETLYVSVFERDSTSKLGLMAMSQIGISHFRQKDWTGSLAAFQRRIALDPNDGEAYYYTGLCYKEMGQYPQALSALQRAATLDSTKAERFFWLGLMYDQQKSAPEAKAAYERAVALDTSGKAVNSGIALRQLGYFDLVDKAYGDAVQHLERSAEINPKDALTLVWLAQAYQNSGNRAKALEYYRRALGVDPNNADAKKGIATLSGGASARQGGTP